MKNIWYFICIISNLSMAVFLFSSIEATLIGLHLNADKIEYICFNQRGNISTLNGSSLKLVDKLINRADINTWLAKAWTAINRLLVIWRSDLTDKIKHSFFQVAIMSILLYGCAAWMLTKRMEKKLDGNYARMLRAILKKSWRLHSTKQQLYGHRPPIRKLSKLNEPDMQNTATEVRTNA